MKSRRDQQASARQRSAIQRERDALLVQRELMYVQRVSRLARCEVRDLTACAWLGLYEAKLRYDSSRGYSFSAFARARIRGAIFDGLAELGSIGSRGVRFIKRAQVHEHSRGELRDQVSSESSLGGEARDLSDLLTRDVDRFVEDYNRLESGIARSLFEYINIDTGIRAREPDEGYVSLGRRARETPESLLIKREEIEALRAQVSRAFERLSTRDQEVLIAVYDLRGVGDSATRFAHRMKVHRSTVARRRASALAHLKAIIADLNAIDTPRAKPHPVEVSRASA